MAVESESGPTEGGRQRRVKREDVRRRLLNAAYGVFAERGFEGASLERVAEAAGFSKGAVYSNFSSKDELFFELVAARIDERLEAVRAATERQVAGPMAGEGGAAGSVARAAGRALREIGEADPEWQLLFLEFWLRCARSEELRTKLAERRRVMRGRIADLVEAEAKAAGARIGRAEAMDLATTALALSNGFGIEGIIDAKAVPPSLLGEVLSRVVAGSGFEQQIA
jgi:AcrR family transcriptional regulator